MEMKSNEKEILVSQSVFSDCKLDWVLDLYLDRSVYSNFLSEDEKKRSYNRLIEIGKYYSVMLLDRVVTMFYSKIVDEEDKKIIKELSIYQDSVQANKMLSILAVKETVTGRTLLTFFYRKLYPNDKPSAFYLKEVMENSDILKGICDHFLEHARLKSPKNRAFASTCIKKPFKDIFKLITDFENYSALGFCDSAKVLGEGEEGSVVEFEWGKELTVSFEITKREVSRKECILEMTYRNRNDKKIKRIDSYRVIPLSRRKSFLLAEIVIYKVKEGKIESLKENLKKMLANIKRIM